MARFRNTKTGAVVSRDDSKPALDGEWEPADKAPKATAKKASSSKQSK